MTKQEHIGAHVSGLTLQFKNIHLNISRPDHKKIMDVWQRALSDLPDDGDKIDALFAPLYSEDKMPTPDSVRAAWWRKRNPAGDNRSEYERPRVKRDLIKEALASCSLYGIAVVKLINRKLVGQKHFEELKSISDEHAVHCPSVEEMMRAK